MSAPAFPVPLEAAPAAEAASDSSAPPRRWLWIVVPVWAALYSLLLAVSFARLSARTFHDPDDQLRLQQVRDLLGGQSWFDLHQYRIDAVGGGVLMHWSRLVDVPCDIHTLAQIGERYDISIAPVHSEVVRLLRTPELKNHLKWARS